MTSITLHDQVVAAKMKKRSEETQTLRVGCSKAETKIFAPPQSPSRVAGRPKFNQLQTQFGENRCTQFRIIVVTARPTHPQTNKQDRLQYTAPQLARSVITTDDSITGPRYQVGLASLWYTIGT